MISGDIVENRKCGRDVLILLQNCAIFPTNGLFRLRDSNNENYVMVKNSVNSRPMQISGIPRILVASEIRLYRKGLTTILNGDGRLEVRATCADLATACDVVQAEAIDAALLDTSMTGALEFVQQVRRKSRDVKIIAMGLTETVEDVMPYIESGISAYVRREGTVDDVVKAVLCALSGEMICSRAIVAALRRRVTRLASSIATFSSAPILTPREQQVARSLEFGMSNKQIAKSLHITVSTVKNHVHSVLEKLRCRTRLEAAARLRELNSTGLIAMRPSV